MEKNNNQGVFPSRNKLIFKENEFECHLAMTLQVKQFIYFLKFPPSTRFYFFPC